MTIQHLKARLKLNCPDCNTGLGRDHAFCSGCGAHGEDAVAQARQHRRLRTLHLDPDTVDMLRGYINRGGPVEKDGKRLVLGVSHFRVRQVVRECARRAGLPTLVNPDTGKVWGVSPHRLRDTFAVHAMKVDDSGDGLRLLQEHLLRVLQLPLGPAFEAIALRHLLPPLLELVRMLSPRGYLSRPLTLEARPRG